MSTSTHLICNKPLGVAFGAAVESSTIDVTRNEDPEIIAYKKNDGMLR